MGEPVNTMLGLRTLRFAEVSLDPSVKAREVVDPDVIEGLQRAYRHGDPVPAPVVFLDGTTYWLSDGFARFEALRSASAPDYQGKALFDVRAGTKRDAILWAIGANRGQHAQRWGIPERRRAVTRLLLDPEWRGWSDRTIALKCGCAHSFVGIMRVRLGPAASSETRKQVRGGNVVTLPRDRTHNAVQNVRAGNGRTPSVTTNLNEVECRALCQLFETIAAGGDARQLVRSSALQNVFKKALSARKRLAAGRGT